MARVIVNFVWPSSAQYTGGVVVLYEFANLLARRGVDVQFVHGPTTPWRVDSVDEITWFDFDPAIRHFVVDDPADPSVPDGDVVFSAFVEPRLGLPAAIIQGHKMMAARWERPSFRFPGLKVVVARWLVDVGVRYGVPVEQIVHVPLGLDHHLFKVEVPFDQRPYDVAVLYNKHPAKGWKVGLRALERLHEERPDLRVCAFSVVPPEHTLPDWIDFRIATDRSYLADELLNRSKVVLQASWHEGFGLVAAEAMASGCALVTTDNGGSEDYAFDGETALVVRPGDDAGLASAVGRLLDDDDLRVRLAEAGAALVRRLTWENAGDLLLGHLREYVADPARFQMPMGPDLSGEDGSDDDDVVRDVLDVDEDGRVVPLLAATARSGLREDDLVWNLVWTGGVFDHLRYFAASQIAQTRGRFRFVANGCAPGQIEEMEAFRAQHPRVIEVFHAFDDMLAHGQALDEVRAVRDDGPCFAFIDPDIEAKGPFAAELLDLLPGHGAVTSGKEIWSRDSILPAKHPGVAGEFFFSEDGFVYGSPHLAIYDRRALDATCERWGVGLGSAGPDMPDHTKAQMDALGQQFLVYDTAKIVNILLTGDAHPIVHRDLPQLLHIGGLSHYLAPSGYITTADGTQEPEWARWDRVAPRLEVARLAAQVLRASIDGTEAAPVPVVDDPHLAAVLPMVAEDVARMVERYGSWMPRSTPSGGSRAPG